LSSGGINEEASILVNLLAHRESVPRLAHGKGEREVNPFPQVSQAGVRGLDEEARRGGCDPRVLLYVGVDTAVLGGEERATGWRSGWRLPATLFVVLKMVWELQSELGSRS